MAAGTGTASQVTDEYDYLPPKPAGPNPPAAAAQTSAADDYEYLPPRGSPDTKLPGATPRLTEMVRSGQVPAAPETATEKAAEQPTWGQAAKTTAKNLASGMWNFGKRLLTPTPTNPDQLTKTPEEIAQELPQAQERISAQQADVAAEKQAMGERKAEGYNPLYRVLAPFVDETGLVPINARRMEEQAKAGQTRQVATDTAGATALAASPYLIKAGTYAAEHIGAPLARAVTEAASDIMPERVKSLTRNFGITKPPPEKALTQALQPGVNIPRAAESFEIGGPRLQNVAQGMGEQITEPGHLIPGAKVMQAAKHGIWDAIEERIGPLDDRLADTTDVANAMKEAVPDRIREQYPEQAARLDKRAETYIGQKSLRQLENNIESANNDLRGLYSRPNLTDSSVSADAAMTKAEVEANRALLDRKVEELSGNEDVATLKREYGALRDIEKAAARANRVVSRQKNMPLYEGLAALSAAGDLVSGDLFGAAKGAFKIGVGRYLQRLRDPNYLIDQAFQGRNAFKPAADIPAAKPPIPHDPEQGTRVNLAPERTVGPGPAAAQLPEGRTLITPAPPDKSGPIPPEERINLGGYAQQQTATSGTPTHDQLTAAIRGKGHDPGFADEHATELLEQVSGKGNWNGAERRSAPTKIAMWMGPERRGYAGQVAEAAKPKPKAAAVAKPITRTPKLSVDDIRNGKLDDLDKLRDLKDNSQTDPKLRAAAARRYQDLTFRAEQGKAGPTAPKAEAAPAQAPTKEAPESQGSQKPSEARKPALKQKSDYSQAEIDRYEAEMRGATDLANILPRPGRYFDEYAEGEHSLAGQYKIKQGQRPAGNWRGVTAQKGNIAGQFPWFNDPEITASRVTKALHKSGGADWRYVMDKIAKSHAGD
jgi:hypothetical protein